MTNEQVIDAAKFFAVCAIALVITYQVIQHEYELEWDNNTGSISLRPVARVIVE